MELAETRADDLGLVPAGGRRGLPLGRSAQRERQISGDLSASCPRPATTSWPRSTGRCAAEARHLRRDRARRRLRLVMLRDAGGAPAGGQGARGRGAARARPRCAGHRAAAERRASAGAAGLAGRRLGDYASTYLALGYGLDPTPWRRSRSSRPEFRNRISSRPVRDLKAGRPPVSASGGTKAIVAALAANLAIAVAKFVAFAASPGRRRCWRRASTRWPTRATRAAAARRQAGAARERRRSTRSATAASATSTPSWSPSCCSPSAASSRSTRAVHKITHPHADRVAGTGPFGVLVFAIIAEASPSAPRSWSPTQVRGKQSWVAVHPPRQGARAAGRPAGGPRRAGRPGPRARSAWRWRVVTGDGVWDGIGTL